MLQAESPKRARRISVNSSFSSSNGACPTPPSPVDRFIPRRRSIDASTQSFILSENNPIENVAGPTASNQSSADFDAALRVALLSSPSLSKPAALSPHSENFGSPRRRTTTSTSEQPVSPSPTGRTAGPRVLNFSDADLDVANDSPLAARVTIGSSGAASSSPVRKVRLTRQIPSSPTRILDAPDIIDDYYLNLLSWSSSNILAVALGPAVYLWNAETNTVQLLCQLENGDMVTSVSWMSGGKTETLAVGCNSSSVTIWDASAQKSLCALGGHDARVASLSWNPTQKNILSSGGRDSIVLNHDIRSHNSAVATLRGHRQEVCGLKWSPDGGTLASGGNENYLCLWDACMSGHRAGDTTPRVILSEHKAAVKALAWAPFQRSLLASGGGTADRTIKFWNTNTGSMLESVDSGSQVCSLLWSPHKKELVSSHGFSQNQLVLWHYPTMTKLKDFTGHTARVLHLDQSPDGSTVVSAAADETLRFWSIFGAPRKSQGQSGQFLGTGLSSTTTIR